MTSSDLSCVIISVAFMICFTIISVFGSVFGKHSD